MRPLLAVAAWLVLVAGAGEARAQAANQCAAANALPLINAPADSGWTQDGANGLLHTPTLNANQATTRYGTQAGGAIRLAGELQWNNATGGSGLATMTILVNGVTYAQLSTSPTSAGQTSTAGTFAGQNGASVSVDGAAESASQAFVGDASTGRTYRPVTVTLPLSVTQVTSVQYVYHANYEGAGADDDIRFRNLNTSQCKASLRLQKQIVTGRESNTDQFALGIARSGTTVATTTTTGNGTTVNNGLLTVAPFDIGVAYTLSETGAGTTDLDDYTSTYSCSNASSGTGTVLPSGTGTSFAITPASGDDITCTIVNTRKPVTLTLTKISHGGTRAFTFTGNNGWTSQTLTTVTPGVGVTGATQALNNPLAATTITESLPPGFVLGGVTCTGMGAGGAVTTGASSFTLNAAAMDAGSEIACVIVNTVPDQPAFPGCTADMYLSQGPNPNTPTTLYRVGTATNPMTFPPIGQGTHVYNGIGFNPVDNYIYGINHGGGTGSRLIRIGADGSTLDLGPVAGLPVTNWVNGTFSADGKLYVLPGDGSTGLRAIDVQSNTSTLITLSQSVSVADFAWIDGLIYAVQQNNGQLRSIDPASGAVTNIGSPQGQIQLGAMWGSPTGLFGNANGGIGFYQIDLETGVRTLLSSSPGASVNDGANCPTAPITFPADLSVTKTNTPAQGPDDLPGDAYVPGETRTYTLVVTNHGPFGVQNATVSDPVPAGIDPGTVSWTCTGTSGGAVCGAPGGTGAIGDTGLDLPAGAVATYTMTMTVPATHTGDLVNVATVAPPASNTDPTPGNNTATDTDRQASTDLRIVKTSDVGTVLSGANVVFTLVVSNAGPDAVAGAQVHDPAVAGLDCTAAGLPALACSAAGGASCPAMPTTAGLQTAPGLTLPLLPDGGSVTFTLTCTATASGLP